MSRPAELRPRRVNTPPVHVQLSLKQAKCVLNAAEYGGLGVMAADRTSVGHGIKRIKAAIYRAEHREGKASK